ncbi:MAG: mycothiol synthase [Actinomycetota bacterium]|nr:mycothiol synthase [Actinomycetota bacterium]
MAQGIDIIRSQVDGRTRAAVDALLERAALHGAREPLGERMRLDLETGGAPGLTLLVCWEDEMTLCGFAQLRHEAASWSLELVIAPVVTAPGSAADELKVRRRLLDASLNEVAAHGGGLLHYRAPAATASESTIALKAGLTLTREVLQLRVRLPLPLDVSRAARAVAVRPFVIGADETAWLEVNNRAFRGHPEQGGWSLADLRERQTQPWFDPRGFLLASEGSRLTGFCWTKVHGTGPSALGEIYVVAVDPDHHGRGLGRALTTAGLAYLASRQITTGMLYVDASNSPARHMYEGLGFTLHHADRIFTATVPQREAGSVSTRPGSGP